MLINTFYIPVWCYELQIEITDHIKAMNPSDLAQRNPSLK